MAQGIPTIPAKSWNAARAIALRNQAFRGLGVRLRWTPDGIVVSAEGAEEFRHPWQLACRWQEDGESGSWVATVRPGFVNGREVTIHATRDEEELEVPLTDEQPPELTLANFRNPATAAGVTANLAGQFQQTAGEGYPAFFESLGVVPAAKGGTVGAEDPQPGRTRQIRACDVVLITPRLATRQKITVTDPRAEGQTVDLSTEFVNTEFSNAPAHRLIARPKHTGPPEPTLLERLEGTAVEPQTDELKLSTVYLVSPPGAGEDAQPDESWTAYPVYFVFWNLAHASLAQLPEAPPKPLRVDIPLAGGVAQPVVNGLLSLANDQASAVAAYLGAGDFHGIYWAPSGIGILSSKRPTPATTSEQTDTAGLDPRRRREQRESAKAATAADVPPLNPAFPYRKTPFDPFFFGLEDEPAPATA
jgi:hypothetical protein